MEGPLCSSCGFTNRADAQFCTQCGQALSAAPIEPEDAPEAYFADSRTPPDTLPARPGCVTFYAALLILGAVASLVTALLLRESSKNALLLMLYSLGIAIAGVAVAIGLLRQRNWARIGAMLLIGLSMAGLMVEVLAVGTSGLPVLVGSSPAILVVWWFAKNKQYFA